MATNAERWSELSCVTLQDKLWQRFWAVLSSCDYSGVTRKSKRCKGVTL
jgi:hypothetical protein